MVTCVHCGNNVVPVKPGINWFWLLFWLVFGFVGAIFYILINRSKPPVKCPVCHKNVYK